MADAKVMLGKGKIQDHTLQRCGGFQRSFKTNSSYYRRKSWCQWFPVQVCFCYITDQFPRGDIITQICWLKTPDIYSCTVLEHRYMKSKHQKSHIFSEDFREESYLAYSSFWSYVQIFNPFRVYFWNGEGNGNPLQYYCLENSMDRRAWQATVHGVTKSWTRLNDFTSLPLEPRNH